MGLKQVPEIIENFGALVCPHCGAGRESRIVGLVWDSREQNWRCFLCGFRAYEAGKPPALFFHSQIDC